MRNTNITTTDDTNCGRHSPPVRASVAPKTPPLTGVNSVVENPSRRRNRHGAGSTEIPAAPEVTPTVSTPPLTPTASSVMPVLRNARTSVRRRLFFEHQDDTPDDTMWETDNRTNAFLESMRVDRERARQMWNFDFETETPLPGIWQWERIEDNQNNISLDLNSIDPNEVCHNANNQGRCGNLNQSGDADLNQGRCADLSQIGASESNQHLLCQDRSQDQYSDSSQDGSVELSQNRFVESNGTESTKNVPCQDASAEFNQGEHSDSSQDGHVESSQEKFVESNTAESK